MRRCEYNLVMRNDSVREEGRVKERLIGISRFLD